MEKKISLIGILLIAGAIRIIGIKSYPVSLTMDEVAIGYSSYSMLKTGLDEWSQPFPLAFKSVGDYKPPVNIYLNVLPEAIFGLSEFAVRIGVAVLGSLTSVLIVVWFRAIKFSWRSSLFGGFWLAILPWHWHFSRFGLEAVTGLFFLLLALNLFYVALRKQDMRWLSLSVFAASMSVWSYHSNRVFVPLISLILISFYRKKLAWTKTKKNIILPLVIFGVFFIPFLYLSIFTPAIRERAAMTSILRDPDLVHNLHNTWGDIPIIFHHWAGKYISYYDLRFWFWKGMSFTPPGFPDLGILIPADCILFFIGVYVLARRGSESQKTIALTWFFLGPLAASFTMNDLHTLRTLVWIPFFGLVVSQGFEQLLRAGKKIYFAIYLVLVAWSMLYAFDLYIYQMPRFNAELYQFGFKQAALYACKHQAEYEHIIISPTFGTLGPQFWSIPDYYVLFYCAYPPHQYQADKKHINKFDFYRVDFRKELESKVKTLMIAARWDFSNLQPKPEYVLDEIKYPSGESALYVTTTNP